MKLSTKSWHAKLFDLTYPTVLPKNLCPYFWKIVLACIIFIPMAAWFTPLYLFKRVDKLFNKEVDFSISSDGFCSVLFAAAFAINVAVFLLFGMAAMWFFPIDFNKEANWVQVVGIIGWTITILVGSGIGFAMIKEKIEERKERRGGATKEPSPNILVEFIKAKYNKYCPQIDWESRTEA